ncbi:pituitary tumor-transforming gene 1 protein-interacting protein isoform X2 [Sus scrofa]|uniref:pituitary tumor-transforming gene 1 protein-interacting protein isoform X2 n=1 Tax=Sus scrofa TaxID=9823 RepID=UPI000A2AF5A1|nr:pituitary tumor-transforming gene 1 protein-interacting protein isoform X2 [Sus scrofa]
MSPAGFYWDSVLVIGLPPRIRGCTVQKNCQMCTEDNSCFWCSQENTCKRICFPYFGCQLSSAFWLNCRIDMFGFLMLLLLIILIIAFICQYCLYLHYMHRPTLLFSFFGLDAFFKKDQ